MQGFGVHTFRLIDAQGIARFVKFHWKPLQGVLSLVWDEAQKIAGKDPDFHRRDLWQAIEEGNYPEWELGVQVVEEADEHSFDFDLLDPTKIIPEEQVPVIPLGRMVLNRNPDNFFAETEQVAFCPAHIVPGIDFSNDPLLQGRLFSYTDTQLSRLGGPNFHEIPINRPVCPFHNNQRDAAHRQRIDKGRAAYEPNSIDGGWPKETPAGPSDGGFESYRERVDAHKVRARSPSFADHFSQPALFYRSLSETEQGHVVDAYSFELGKVQRPWIRERQVREILARIDHDLARRVAANLGVSLEGVDSEAPCSQRSAALSQMKLQAQDIRGRKVAVLVADGVDGQALDDICQALMAEGAKAELLGPSTAPVRDSAGATRALVGSMAGEPSVTYDAVLVPGGSSVATLAAQGVARHYLLEAYKHLKPLALLGEASSLAQQLGLQEDPGLLLGAGYADVAGGLRDALLQHRIWAREARAASIPA
jgi:catalase